MCPVEGIKRKGKKWNEGQVSKLWPCLGRDMKVNPFFWHLFQTMNAFLNIFFVLQTRSLHSPRYCVRSNGNPDEHWHQVRRLCCLQGRRLQTHNWPFHVHQSVQKLHPCNPDPPGFFHPVGAESAFATIPSQNDSPVQCWQVWIHPVDPTLWTDAKNSCYLRWEL